MSRCFNVSYEKFEFQCCFIASHYIALHPILYFKMFQRSSRYPNCEANSFQLPRVPSTEAAASQVGQMLVRYCGSLANWGCRESRPIRKTYKSIVLCFFWGFRRCFLEHPKIPETCLSRIDVYVVAIVSIGHGHLNCDAREGLLQFRSLKIRKTGNQHYFL